MLHINNYCSQLQLAKTVIFTHSIAKMQWYLKYANTITVLKYCSTLHAAINYVYVNVYLAVKIKTSNILNSYL